MGEFVIREIMPKCNYCDYKYENLSDFNKHLNDNHTKCIGCGKVFDNKDDGALCEDCFMENKPNWKKGDLIVLLGHNGGALSILEAVRDPVYCSTLFSSEKDWHYGLRNCKEFRLATKNDVDNEIKFQKEKVRREQSWLDELLNFGEILDNK